jgi:hypothetical protein
MTLTADTPPHELLEAAGQLEPPVRLVPVIEALGCRWRYADEYLPRVDASEPDLILVPRGRGNDPLVRLGIAHDLRHAALRIPGHFTDLAIPYLHDREVSFDRWARQLLMPTGWFKLDALRRRPVRALERRYQVPWRAVIDRALELELCHLICRDRESYRLYLDHPWWKSTKEPLGRRLAYMTTHRYCEMVVNGRSCGVLAVSVHHTPSGYARLGRERDEDLRALCAIHHGVQHPRLGAEQLQLDLDEGDPPPT